MGSFWVFLIGAPAMWAVLLALSVAIVGVVIAYCAERKRRKEAERREAHAQRELELREKGLKIQEEMLRGERAKREQELYRLRRDYQTAGWLEWQQRQEFEKELHSTVEGRLFAKAIGKRADAVFAREDLFQRWRRTGQIWPDKKGK